MAPALPTIVIDNASTDNTVDRVRTHEGVRLTANPDNRGFSGAVNQAIRATPDADLFLLLNPDAELLTGPEPLLEAAGLYGIAAGKLVDRSGKPQTGFSIRRFPTPWTFVFEVLGINRLWPSNRINQQYRYLDRDMDVAGPVEQPAGAFLAFRREVWEHLGGFDEAFHPVWFEDVDFCRRAAVAGYRIEYVPSVAAAHSGGHSVKRLPAARQIMAWYGSLLKYAAKHFRPVPYRAICVAVMLTSVPRMILGMINERSLEPAAAYIRIIWVASLCLATRRRSRLSAGLI
jgi:N-acetylglucosaminyl-diphospho-decaprenol L-rhamnosyltransferase